MKTKSIEWAFPTSPNAKKLGFISGCWCVQVGEQNESMEALAGFTTREAAFAHAWELPLPWCKMWARRNPLLAGETRRPITL